MSEGDPRRKSDPTLLERQVAQILVEDLERQEEVETHRKAREEFLKERLQKISRIGNCLIFNAGAILRKVRKYRDAAVESTLPSNRKVGEPIDFKIGDVDISVNFYPFDISQVSRRMSLDITDGEHVEHLFVSTYLGLSNDEPERRIKYWESIEDLETKPVYGLSAALKGFRMLRKIKKLERVS